MADDVVIIPLGDRFLATSQDQLQEALAKGQEILGKAESKQVPLPLSLL